MPTESMPAESARPLTRREVEVLTHLLAGKSSHQVADALYLSKRTVDFHVANAYDKLGVRSRVQAFRRMSALGLLPKDLGLLPQEAVMPRCADQRPDRDRLAALAGRPCYHCNRNGIRAHVVWDGAVLRCLIPPSGFLGMEFGPHTWGDPDTAEQDLK